jgi:hypothetical protein
MGNVKKAETLGMPHGTATNRLRKQLLFKYVCLAGDNICYKCKNIIELIDDLSIEHIKPWEGRSAELFWDLSNIAFSHISCNRPHVNGAVRRRISLDGDVFRCCSCKQTKERSNFGISSSRWNNVQSECKDCRNKRPRVRQSS